MILLHEDFPGILKQIKKVKYIEQQPSYVYPNFSLPKSGEIKIINIFSNQLPLFLGFGESFETLAFAKCLKIKCAISKIAIEYLGIDFCFSIGLLLPKTTART